MKIETMCCNCANYDAENVDCTGLARCLITHTLTYAEDNCAKCPFFTETLPPVKHEWMDAERIKPEDTSVTCVLAVLPLEELPFEDDEYTYWPNLAYWDGEQWRELDGRVIDYPGISMWCRVNNLPQEE